MQVLQLRVKELEQNAFLIWKKLLEMDFLKYKLKLKNGN